jgi:uncharacterized Ntn-hydrolase superfamily protein
MWLTTFSIAARCPRTGQLGAALATAIPAAGPLALHLRAGVGAIASQAWVNPYLGIDGLDLLASGHSPAETLELLIQRDPGIEARQLGIVDRHGDAAAFSGSQCPDSYGHRTGDGFSVQGNILAGPEVVDRMFEVAEATASLPLDERLMQVLEAGQAAGGDRRGKQSAALQVVGNEAYGLVDLRVDDHPEPVAELRRILELTRAQVRPLIEILPTRASPNGGEAPPGLVDILVKPPGERPQR